jgi:hypothetical protein
LVNTDTVAAVAQTSPGQRTTRQAIVNPSVPAPASTQPPKRKKRTKAEIEAEKAEQLQAQAKAKTAEKRMKKSLDKHAEEVRKKDRLVTEQRQTQLVRHRTEVNVIHSSPADCDEDFSEALENISLDSDWEEEAQIAGGSELGLEADLDASDLDGTDVADEEPDFENPQVSATSISYRNDG